MSKVSHWMLIEDGADQEWPLCDNEAVRILWSKDPADRSRKFSVGQPGHESLAREAADAECERCIEVGKKLGMTSMIAGGPN